MKNKTWWRCFVFCRRFLFIYSFVGGVRTLMCDHMTLNCCHQENKEQTDLSCWNAGNRVNNKNIQMWPVNNLLHQFHLHLWNIIRVHSQNKSSVYRTFDHMISEQNTFIITVYCFCCCLVLFVVVAAICCCCLLLFIVFVCCCCYLLLFVVFVC